MNLMLWKIKLFEMNFEVQYKNDFNIIIKKQINYLINEIEQSDWVDDKMIVCAAIILTGLSYKDKNQLPPL